MRGHWPLVTFTSILPPPCLPALRRELSPGVLLGWEGSSGDQLSSFMVLSATPKLQKCYMYCEANILAWYLYSIYISSLIAIGDSIRWQTGSPDIKGLLLLTQINEKSKDLFHKDETHKCNWIRLFLHLRLKWPFPLNFSDYDLKSFKVSSSLV